MGSVLCGQLGAHKGERYRVRVLAVGINQWTGRMEATVQKLAGPL